VNPIAADPTGAWVLSSAGGSGVLTHVGLGYKLPQQFSLAYDPVAVAVGERDVWVAAKNVSVDAVLRISRITGAVLATVPLPGARITIGGPNPGFQSIAAGEGAVWAARGRTVYRIDPATTRITGTVSLPAKQVLQVAAGDGAVWISVYGSSGNALMRIDPRTLRIKTTIPAPTVAGSQNESEASHLAVDSRGVWWIGADSGNVWRIDPRAGKIVSTIRVTPPFHSSGDFQPFGIAAGARGVWVTVTTAP
jgi:ligand-binding sensor domain-containing protein